MIAPRTPFRQQGTTLFSSVLLFTVVRAQSDPSITDDGYISQKYEICKDDIGACSGLISELRDLWVSLREFYSAYASSLLSVSLLLSAASGGSRPEQTVLSHASSSNKIPGPASSVFTLYVLAAHC